MRRRIAVTGAVLAALVGEWLGHSLSYLRIAGLAGLQAGLTSGVHDYMVPVGLALLVSAAAGAAVWTRAWLALGRRLDRSAASLARLRRGAGPPAAAPGGTRPVGGSRRPSHTPSFAARIVALATALAVAQCSLYLLQENLERALHGLPTVGLSPLFDSYGAAAWIQAALGVLLATLLVAAMRLLSAKRSVADQCERMVRAIWERAVRSTSSPRPRLSDVLPTQLQFRSALWCRPPPVLAAV